MDEAKRRKEIEHGLQAKQILEAPVWQEAYDEIQNNLLSEMLSENVDSNRTLEVKREILALHRVEKYIQSVMATGVMAQRQLEEHYNGRK